jgi:hypothetical protein
VKRLIVTKLDWPALLAKVFRTADGKNRAAAPGRLLP